MIDHINSFNNIIDEFYVRVEILGDFSTEVTSAAFSTFSVLPLYDPFIASESSPKERKLKKKQKGLIKRPKDVAKDRESHVPVVTMDGVFEGKVQRKGIN